jgi:hypothetical protein
MDTEIPNIIPTRPRHIEQLKVRRESLLMNLAKCLFLVLAFLVFGGTLVSISRGGNDLTLAAGSAAACFLAIMSRIFQAEQYRP